MSVASAWAAAGVTPGFRRPTATIHARLGNAAQVVGGPEGDVVGPGDEAEAAGHDPDHRPGLAVHADRRPDHVGGAAQQPLPGLVADDDRAGFLLLDHVVEVLAAIRATQERRDPRDRRGRSRPPASGRRGSPRLAGQGDRGAAALEEAERLERAARARGRPARSPSRAAGWRCRAPCPWSTAPPGGPRPRSAAGSSRRCSPRCTSWWWPRRRGPGRGRRPRPGSGSALQRRSA